MSTKSKVKVPKTAKEIGDARWDDVIPFDTNFEQGDMSLERSAYKGFETSPAVPEVPGIHNLILKAIRETEGAALEMNDWHTCEKKHCYAGWVTTLSGKKGRELEMETGPATAAALILFKSCPWIDHVPNFHAENEPTMRLIRSRAETERKKGLYKAKEKK